MSQLNGSTSSPGSPVTILVGMNPIDAAIVSGGSAEDVFAFCFLNGLGLTDDLAPGAIYQGTGMAYQASSVITNPQITSKPVNVLPGQTLLDIAMQQLGSVEGVFALALLNQMSITGDLVEGSALDYSLTPFSLTVLKVYQNNGYKPASGLSTAGGAMPVLLSGVDYWAIEFDFTVQ